ncbi:uncharacterized protein LOC127286168 [Leptopilina boulardi]|uniref:uncharacterized protein LOC127286168 n=1 Tax=Leptopilina boulardi TaxID=63433 RepID=UPI0021F52B77|nr:uncharacterized protein LOC127286168 [Leptopilina boulardi]
MFKCFGCECSFSNNETLILHVELAHMYWDTFQCTESECTKKYVNFYSYKKHRNLKHGVQLHPHETSETNFFNADSNFPFAVEDVTTDEELYTDSSGSSSDESEYFDEEQIEDSISFDVSGKYGTNFKTKTTLFAAKLYKLSSVPRKYVNEIINDVSDLFECYKNSFKNEFNNKAASFSKNSFTLSEINEVFAELSNPFHNIQTEAKRCKLFETNGTFIPPQNYKLGEAKVIVEKNGEKISCIKEICAQFIPIRKVLKLFFELPDVLKNTLQYMNNVQENKIVIQNIIQGSLYQEKVKAFKDKTLLPVILAFDDYETNNPLGSHKGISKCGATYLSCPALPPDLRSKLENIFLFLLFNTKHRAQYINKIIFMKAMEELEFILHEGIPITVDNVTKQVHFLLILIYEDNLGIKSIFGYAESFQATYFCWHCLTRRNDIQFVFNERDCKLRNRENYDELLAKNDVSLSGIKEVCVFDEMSNFDHRESVYVDPLHDVPDGILRYDVAESLNYFIYKKKYFTIANLNLRLAGFNYGDN